MNKEIADIRKDYIKETLLETNVASDPFKQFSVWWSEATSSDIDEVNAMTLATATKDGTPSARIVLLKGFSEEGFIFFTNYQSNKGKAIEQNPKAALVFFWKELERQVRIEGTVEKISDKDSDAYYQSRPVASRVGAWASPQSEPIDNREVVEDKFKIYSERFFNALIDRPEYWGGYRVIPSKFEFWQGRPSRLHDRIEYNLQPGGNWTIQRLAP